MAIADERAIFMSRRIAYWGTTVIVATMLLGSLSYLTGNEQVVSGFAKAGYPQHLRIVLVGKERSVT